MTQMLGALFRFPVGGDVVRAVCPYGVNGPTPTTLRISPMAILGLKSTTQSLR